MRYCKTQAGEYMLVYAGHDLPAGAIEITEAEFLAGAMPAQEDV